MATNSKMCLTLSQKILFFKMNLWDNRSKRVKEDRKSLDSKFKNAKCLKKKLRRNMYISNLSRTSNPTKRVLS